MELEGGVELDRHLNQLMQCLALILQTLPQLGELPILVRELPREIACVRHGCLSSSSVTGEGLGLSISLPHSLYTVDLWLRQVVPG